jgi:hypothetical protein
MIIEKMKKVILVIKILQMRMRLEAVIVPIEMAVMLGIVLLKN